jgi:cellulose synthase/poly-beta-1,6-N-acetylglucosamine synthase-like glycosyltransferase
MLVVIDIESAGCKADASNAGINAAAGALVLIIDADTMLEPDALSRAVLPFLEDTTYRGGGRYVAIANGCRVEDGRVIDVAMPRSWLARCQIVEYMRSFPPVPLGVRRPERPHRHLRRVRIVPP